MILLPSFTEVRPQKREMHELGITMNIVSVVTEHAAGRRVKRVAIEIGALSAIVPGAIEFCFDVCTEGTLLEGAELEIEVIAGLGKCFDCGQEVMLSFPVGEICECGSRQIECIAGTELKVKEMEVL